MMRRSVFWKVAGVLVGVQVATAVTAIFLSLRLTADRSQVLVANSLRLRLDGVAEEVEQRSSLLEGVEGLPYTIRLDLTRRFPDPITLLNPDGTVVDVLSTDSLPSRLPLPDSLAEYLAADTLIVNLGQRGRPPWQTSWGLAPLYDADGYLAGGLLVQPLRESVAAELAGTREAYIRAVALSAVLAGLTAVLLGSLFTWRLVQPLRRITQRVEAIGRGDYTNRIQIKSEDEIGRLALAVNHMAGQVEHSVEALRATDKLRRELIANIGHDLRTPLTAVLGYMEEAERYMGEGGVDQSRQALDRAQRQGLYLRNLVRDLFELSVLDSVPPPLRKEPIPLAELLSDAVRSHASRFEAAGITLTTQIEPDLPIFTGDGIRLLRVMDNLLSNACRHTSEGGTVTVEAGVTEEQVTIRVRDTGEGMTPDVLANVFERHFRGTDARTRPSRRTGLGLAISRAIARAHGGELSAESVSGEGSAFTLRLPHPKNAPTAFSDRGVRI